MDKTRESKELMAALTSCRERVEDLQVKVDEAKVKLQMITDKVKKEMNG